MPSPVSGKVLKLAGGAGDVIVTGTMLAQFEVDPSLPQRAEGQDTGHHHGPSHATQASAHAAAPDHGAGAPAPDDGDRVVASDEGGEIAQSGRTVAPADRKSVG